MDTSQKSLGTCDTGMSAAAGNGSVSTYLIVDTLRALRRPTSHEIPASRLAIIFQKDSR